MAQIIEKDELSSIRLQSGQNTGSICLAVNVVLVALKIFTGIASNSISILADGFNNIADCASSAVMILGFHFSNKRKDDRHPYGHGRMEYISGFVVSLFLIATAFALGKAAVVRVMRPQAIFFGLLLFLIQVIAITTKLLLALYIRRINKKIDSPVFRAVFRDTLADSAITTVTLISMLLTPFTSLPADGIAGLIVSLVILWSGIASFLENLDLLLGRGMDEALSQQVTGTILKYSAFRGIEACALYDYGPGARIAFIKVRLGASPHQIEIQNAVRDVSVELKRQFSIDATLYWGAGHAEAKNEGASSNVRAANDKWSLFANGDKEKTA
jgi:cation diffusion facilitator family transporter